MELIVDTSSEELRVILKDKKDYLINKQTGIKHLEHLLPEIDDLLNKKKAKLKDITCFSVVLGPGSFTGVRIGVSTIKAFCNVFKKVKIIGINMLDFLSYTICQIQKQTTDFCVLIKSTSTKYYVGYYTSGGKQKFQKIMDGAEFASCLENKNISVYSYNSEENFGGYSPKKIVVLPGNYISYVDKQKRLKKFIEENELKPVYLALSQAEEELLKKESCK